VPKRIEDAPHRREESAEYMAAWKAKPGRREKQNEWHRAYHAEQMATNPEYVQMKRTSAVWSRRKKKYGLTREAYERMAAAQDGRCAICGEKPDHDLRVDHDHGTGAVRALLCNLCNTGIGSLREDPRIMLEAIEYLARHKKDKK
jgi:Recombination endonuclease VII